jgi:hypothetical protein
MLVFKPLGLYFGIYQGEVMVARNIYGALEHLDKTEGRGGSIVAGWFTDKEEAEKFAAELEGVFGTKNELGVTEDVLYDTANEHPGYNEPRARRNREIAELEGRLAVLRAQQEDD